LRLLNVVEFFFAYKGFGALLLQASLNQDIYLIEASCCGWQIMTI
jgi:hypothetical protein